MRVWDWDLVDDGCVQSAHGFRLATPTILRWYCCVCYAEIVLQFLHATTPDTGGLCSVKHIPDKRILLLRQHRFINVYSNY